MSGPFKLKYKHSAFPFKTKDEPKIEYHKSYSGKDSKLKTSLLGSAAIVDEFGKKKFTSFGAIDLSKTLKSGGKFSLIGSKILEPSMNISAGELRYTTPKGLSIGGELSKGTFIETDPYEGKIVTTSPIKPKIKIGKKWGGGRIKVSTTPDFKSGKVTLSLNIGGGKKKKRK